jgi:hypothetical protein
MNVNIWTQDPLETNSHFALAWKKKNSSAYTAERWSGIEILLKTGRVLLPSFYWLIHFSDLHRTLLKNVRQLLAAFQKGFVKIREMYQPIGRQGLKFKKE